MNKCSNNSNSQGKTEMKEIMKKNKEEYAEYSHNIIQ